MPYDASTTALNTPEKQPPLDPLLFAGKPDALAAELSRLAYWKFETDQEPLIRALSAHGLELAAAFIDNDTNTQAFSCRDGDTCYVVFRGTQTDTFADLKTDLKAWPVKSFGPGPAHAGFVESYCGKLGSETDSIRLQIKEWRASERAGRLIVTGHSLGAALATLCALDHPEAELVTFGSPRVGDGTFARAFAGRTMRRYVDCSDVVTDVPPPIGYEHVCNESYIDRGGTLRDPGPAGFWRLSDRLRAAIVHIARYGFRPGYVPWRRLADHAPVNYVTALLGIR